MIITPETFAFLTTAYGASFNKGFNGAITNVPKIALELLSASFMGKVASGLGKGLIYGLFGMAGDALHDKFFPPEMRATDEARLHAHADQFYKELGLGRPHWPSLVSEAKGETAPLAGTGAETSAPEAAQKAQAAGDALKAALNGPFTPKVDAAPIDDARASAELAGPAIKAALDVTGKPNADMSEIDAAGAKAREAGEAIKTGLGVTGKPTADTSQFDEATTKAQTAGAAIVAGLSVTASPRIDLSHFDALDARIAKSMANLRKLGAAAKAASGDDARGIRHGYQPGSHALHDGTEVY